jgi:hypothetical protein
MLTRRFLLQIVFFWLLLGSSSYAVREIVPKITAHCSYNCLIVEDVRVQLNTHLEWDAPRSFAETISPDGTRALQWWGTNARKVIRLQNLQTGEAHTLQPATDPIRTCVSSAYNEPDTELCQWSDNSEYVVYTWINRDTYEQAVALSSRDGTQAATFTLGADTIAVLGFSKDNEYVALVYGYLHRRQSHPRLAIIATRDFQVTLTTPEDLEWPNGTSAAWSPVGHRLVYALTDELLLADPDYGVTRFRLPALPDGSSRWYGANCPAVQWSADGHYLLLESGYCAGDPATRDLFAVETGALVLVKTFDDIVWLNGVGAAYYWSLEGHILTHFTPTDAAVSTHFLYQENPILWDLRQFDPENHHDHTRTRRIITFRRTERYLILVKDNGATASLELQDIQGGNSFILKVFSSDDLAALADECHCGGDFWRIILEHMVLPKLPRCTVPGFRLDQLRMDDVGQVTWLANLPHGAAIVGQPFGLFDPQCRFTARTLQQGEQVQVEIRELQTGLTHRFPDSLESTLPNNFWDPLQETFFWGVSIMPSPDNHTWLVYWGTYWNGSAYLFWPDQERWQLLFQDNQHDPRYRLYLDTVLWSPDSQRVAFFRQVPGRLTPSLIVVEADGSAHYDLGTFSIFEDSTPPLAWDKCGGLQNHIPR